MRKTQFRSDFCALIQYDNCVGTPSPSAKGLP
jgi:hypothetical protein